MYSGVNDRLLDMSTSFQQDPWPHYLGVHSNWGGSFIVAGIAMAVGLVYFYIIRPVVKERESQRLNDSTRTYLETKRFGDEHH